VSPIVFGLDNNGTDAIFVAAIDDMQIEPLGIKSVMFAFVGAVDGVSV
jgi:hypothetical protein